MKRLLLYLIALSALAIAGHADEPRRYVGEGLGETLIFSSRTALEDDYRTEKIDPHRYRLGTDIVVFVGNRSSGHPVCLYMCAAEEFTAQELKSFRPSTSRKDLPPRHHPMFDRLEVTGRRAGFR